MRQEWEEDGLAGQVALTSSLEHLGAQQSTATTGAKAAPLENGAP